MKQLKLTLKANHLNQTEWFTDRAFAVCDDMQSHSGAFIVMVNIGGPNKQKIIPQVQQKERSLQFMTTWLLCCGH